LYAPDLPGFGATPPPPPVWNVHDYAAFVIAYLDAHDLARVHLIGHSFGGRLGLVLGADHADRFDKIALFDSAGVRSPTPVSQRLRLSVYRGLRDGLARLGARRLSDDLRAWYNQRYGSVDYQQAGALRETFVQVVSEDLLPVAARVSRPTLLLWGDQDEDTPLWQGQLLEQTIPDAGLVTFPGAGHYSYLERLAEAVRIVDHFFRPSDH
ncbi:MAG: alpha/beta fold hydrolase, partial [Chloroflexi bacterium]|nr:alpha/beta fold hydrolase [Chloroflexota bacterium]